MLHQAHLYRKETVDQRKLKGLLDLGEKALTKRVLEKLGRLKVAGASPDVRFFWRFLHTKLYPGLFKDYKVCMEDTDNLRVEVLMKKVTPSDEAMVLTILQVKLEDIMADLRGEESERKQDLLEEEDRRKAEDARLTRVDQNQDRQVGREPEDREVDDEDADSHGEDTTVAMAQGAQKAKKRRGRKAKNKDRPNTELGKQQNVYESYNNRVSDARREDYEMDENGDAKKTDQGDRIPLEKRGATDANGWYSYVIEQVRAAKEQRQANKRKACAANSTALEIDPSKKGDRVVRQKRESYAYRSAIEFDDLLNA